MHQAHFQVALVRRIDAHEVVVSLADFIEFPLREIAIQPGHTRPRGAAASGRQQNLESLADSPAGAMLAAVGEPEDAQSEHTIDGRLALLGVDSNERPALLPAHQQASRIRGAKAVLQIHRRAQALHFVFVEMAGEQPLQQTEILGPAERTGCRRPLIAVLYDLQRLRPLGPQTAHQDAQRLLARFHTHYRADHVPLFGPQMQDAAAMLRGDRVVGRRHLEEHTSILEQSSAGIVRKKLLQQTS